MPPFRISTCRCSKNKCLLSITTPNYAKLPTTTIFLTKPAARLALTRFLPSARVFRLKLTTRFSMTQCIQFLIAPAGDQFINEFHMILDEVKDGMSVKHASDKFYKWRSAFTQAGKDLIFGVKEKSGEEKKEKYMKGRRAVDEGAAEKIGNKIKSTIMKANIRVIASGGSKERAEAILREIESSFNQFSEAASNSFVFQRVSGGELKKLFHDFSYRAFSPDKVLPMNLKELASVFHFPVGIGSQPQLKEARAGIAPAPIEIGQEGIILGINSYRGRDTEIHLAREDRMRHFYAIGQTGTG